MLQFLVAGVVVGCIYAIASSGLLLTYRATGVMNFGFAGLSFAGARTYYWFNTEQHWSIWAAALITILVVCPVLGLIAYVLVLRQLQDCSTLVKVVATVGLGVALPPVCGLVFGDPGPVSAPGLAPLPVGLFSFGDVVVNYDQAIVVSTLVLLLIAGFAVLRFTPAGLSVRAVVDSPAMTALNGGNPARIAAVVWAVSTSLAGLSGVLLAPIIGLASDKFAFLIAGAFTAVLIGRMTSIGIVLGTSLALGVVGSGLQYFLPPTSAITAGVISGIPFAFVLVFLLWEARNGRAQADVVNTGKLDRAIAPDGGARGSSSGADGRAVALRLQFGRGHRLVGRRTVNTVLVLGVIALLPQVLSGFWVSQVAAGLCFGVIFLSYTIVTGEGGMIWLCQISFAGLGAALTAQFSTNAGLPPLTAVLVAAVCVTPIGLFIALLTTRLGGLYVVLATLAFAVLVDSIVLALPRFTGPADQGVPVPTLTAFTNPTNLLYFLLVLLVVIALLIEHFRRSSAGLAMAAVRWSDRGAQSMGIRIAAQKVAVGAAGTFVAALGGGLLAMYLGAAVPSSFTSAGGLVWLAVVVTMGTQSSVAAIVAGLTFAIVPVVFQTYLPLSVSTVPAALFGLGAIMLARHPEGLAAVQARSLEALAARLTRTGRTPAGTTLPEADTAPADLAGVGRS